MTIQDLAKQAESFFQVHPHRDWTVTVKDGAPSWVTELCHRAHGDMLPDDHRYNFIHDALILLAENECQERARCEIEADDFIHDLTNWLASRNDRIGYVQDRVEGKPVSDAFKMLQDSQVNERTEVFDAVEHYLDMMVRNEASHG